MLICQHRVNSIESLKKTSTELGVEVDIRSNGLSLYIAHDPFTKGPLFEDWLESYRHKFLIANVKEEGLETQLREIFVSRNIREWSFLDQSFPFLVKELANGHTKTMVRVSEYESIQTALNLVTRPDWVWLDSFHGNYPRPEEISSLAQSGYKFMVVSPELQSRAPESEISRLKSIFAEVAVGIDAVCTKVPDLWRS
jgi:hypothetical protein